MLTNFDYRLSFCIYSSIETIIVQKGLHINADLQIVIGNIVHMYHLIPSIPHERGTHEELMNNHGLYRHLWDIQLTTAGWQIN